jgi:hypothetical protein
MLGRAIANLLILAGVACLYVVVIGGVMWLLTLGTMGEYIALGIIFLVFGFFLHRMKEEY